MGGILILFIYITSIASNEQFKFKINVNLIKILVTINLLFLLIFITFNQKLLFFNKIQNFEINNILIIKNLIFENNFILNKIYNFPINIITILLINYLFLTLIATVKITNIFEGPLRPKS